MGLFCTKPPADPHLEGISSKKLNFWLGLIRSNTSVLWPLSSGRPVAMTIRPVYIIKIKWEFTLGVEETSKPVKRHSITTWTKLYPIESSVVIFQALELMQSHWPHWHLQLTGHYSLKYPISPNNFLILMVGSSLAPKWRILLASRCYFQKVVVVPKNSLSQHSRTIFKLNSTWMPHKFKTKLTVAKKVCTIICN
jgi:hypothetical protein